MNRRVIVALLVVGLVVIGILVALSVIGTQDFNATWTVYHEKDGVPVYAIQGPGGSDTLVVEVYWTAAGAGIDPDTFIVAGRVDIYLHQAIQGAEKTLLKSYPIYKDGASNMVSSASASFPLANLFADQMQWKDYGWNVVIEGDLTAQVDSTDTGERISRSWSDSVTIKYEWVDGTTFTFVAGFV